ncbi:MAG: hypothetical protein AABW86_02000 [Candidatus Micrarchaeota archaeon]|mgnify:CR=1 FL=1
MGSTFRNSVIHDPGSKGWKQFNPLRLGINGYLLVDDVVHRSINRPAE